MTLSEAIITYRAMHNISQAEFASLANVSTMTINAIENGYQKPTKITLAKIYLVLNEKRKVNLDRFVRKASDELESELENEDKRTET